MPRHAKTHLDVNVRVGYSQAMDGKQTTYYIGDISKELGLSQRAVRYYEELGFIKPTRTGGGFRTYSKHDFDLLKLIVSFKDLGLALDEIHNMIPPSGGGLTGETVRRLREMLSSKRNEFEGRIKKYEEGIREINRVLDLLLSCTTCGRPTKEGECESCLKNKGADSAPLIPPLLFHGEEIPVRLSGTEETGNADGKER